MKSTITCKGCGKSYETSLRWQNFDLCKECFNKPGQNAEPASETNDTESAPETNVEQVVCTECYSAYYGFMGRASGGFSKFVCPRCKKEVFYPLTPFFRTVWWISLGVLALNVLFTGALHPESVVFPGLIFLAPIVVFIRDSSITAKVQAARARYARAVQMSETQPVPSSVCGLCDKEFPSPQATLQHVRTAHGMRESEARGHVR